jgi:hypothetical protein
VDRVHGQWTMAGHTVHHGSAAVQAWSHRGMMVRSPEQGLRPLRGTGAHQQGHKRESGARGTHLGPHRSSAGGVAAGQW